MAATEPHQAAAEQATRTLRHRIVIVGGGTAGITVAARLRRAGQSDVAIVEPAETHYYQPLWTLVGGGAAPAEDSARPMADVIPKGVRRIRERVRAFEPEANRILTEQGTAVAYDVLVVVPGIQLDWDKVNGLPAALDDERVSSNYLYELAPKTWRLIQQTEPGDTLVFTMPSTPIKCAGAPQKIAYLAADDLRRRGIDAKIVYATGGPAIFGVKEFAAVLTRVAAGYGIDVRTGHELVEVRPETQEAVFAVKQGDELEQVTIRYDLLHVCPPQSAPDLVKQSPLADASNPLGWVEVDKHTHQHVRYPNVFSLGDAGSTPNSKTGAAIRKQAPVAVRNILAHLDGTSLRARYDGYASCPLTTAHNRMLLAEFDYDLKPTPSIPLIDTMKPRYDMWLLKRYGLPWMYWHLMLKGRA